MKWFILALLVSILLSCSDYSIISRDLLGARYYKAEYGDTLYSVGFRTGYGYKKIAAWNNMRAPYTLTIGKNLKLYGANKKKSKWQKSTKKKWAKTQASAKINTQLTKLFWRWPVKGRVASNFYATDKKGINIAGKVGGIIRAAEAGMVVYSGSSLVGYGHLLIIKHNDLYLSAYAQNRRLLVKEGQKVKRGQVIAEMGVGANAQPLLYFEIRRNGDSVNPIKYLPQ
jgi:lipoprotein NlpD